MGNRAVITVTDPKPDDLAVYVHWNGGPDSVGAFLEYCDLRGFRAPTDDTYGWARLCEVICNFLGRDGLCVGIDVMGRNSDPGDNGIYYIDGWKVVDRTLGGEHIPLDYLRDGYDHLEMLEGIDAAQPVGHQLGKRFLEGERVDATDLVVGDIVTINTDFEGIADYVVSKLMRPPYASDRSPLLPVVYKYNLEDDDPDTKNLNPNNFLGQGKMKYVRRVGHTEHPELYSGKLRAKDWREIEGELPIEPVPRDVPSTADTLAALDKAVSKVPTTTDQITRDKGIFH